MDTVPPFTRGRGRGAGGHEVNGREVNGRGRQSKNRTWVSGGGSRSGTNTPNHIEGDRWERGGRHGSRGREPNQPRSFPNASLVVPRPPAFENLMSGDEDEDEDEYQEEDENEQEDELNEDVEEPELDTPEAREKFYQELVKAREVERKKAIAEGKMDDPLIPKRLEDAINLVGTCMDMAPRFERYRRERENNLFEWETIPGTKRVDHKRAVKMYERAAGDKTLPSDLRPPIVLKKTLDYLFHDLLPREGFSRTFNFVRDRSRAVRNDFTMQHETGPLAIECHDRCARFHILALHFERERAGFSIALEEQQLMNTLQSLKEFYEDQRGRYESPTELEMRVYHRLIHIRDQKERHEDIPSHITDNPVFKLTTRFRQHVQGKSAPISKTSKLVVDEQGMEIFGELAMVLREQGSVVMIYLVACILERLFGPDTIDDIESIRGDLSIPDIIDGVTTEVEYDENLYDQVDEGFTEESHFNQTTSNGLSSLGKSGLEWPTSNVGSSPTPFSVFKDPPAASIPSNPFSGTSAPPQPARSAFSNLATTPNAFGNTSVFTVPKSEPSTSIFASTTTASSSAPTTSPFASASPFGASPFNAFASTSGTQSAFGNPPTASAFDSKAENPKVVGTSGPFSMTAGVSSTFSQTVSSPFAQVRTSSAPTNGINGSHVTKIQEAPAPSPPEIPSQPPVFARFSAERPLNPAAPSFIPIFKPMPSPLRHNGAEKPFEAEGAASSPSIPSQSLGNSNVISASTHAPSSTGSSIQTSMIDPHEANIIHTSPYINLPSSPHIPSPTTTTPSRPRINTAPSETNTVQPRSPLPQPPPLNKHQTISLPPTPTTMSITSSLPSPGPIKWTKSILDSLKGSLETGVSASSEILSPLVLSSPSSSRSVHNFTNVGSHPASPLSGRKTSSEKLASPLGRMPWVNDKGKEHDTVLRARAIDFATKGALVRDCFDRWRTRLTDKLAWAEACRRSDAYSIKIQRERVSPSPAPDRKRRAALGVSTETPQRKRAKKVSGDYKKPYSDEELARRFKANHEEHERRWAEGSFLQAIRKHVKRTSGTSPPGWQIWLSMNPESDATAIWLERKFDVPASGQWNTESIFSIPLKSSGDSPNSPGVIIFECTPLEGVTDEIERKYRVLDDCSRLRDIIDALPAKRHFVPCLLTISWIHTERKDTSSDLYHMISRMIGEGVLNGHQDFPIASETKALDDKLEEALVSLTLDVEGKLVQSLSVQGIFNTFESAWKDFSAEWLGACSTSGDFDWYLYGRFVEALISLLNVMASSALGLVQSRPTDVLPSVSAQHFLDSDATYDAVISWLETNTIRDTTGDVLRDLQSQRSMNREFPFGTFVDHLYALTVRLTEHRMGGERKNSFYLLKKELTSAHQEVESTANSHAADLRRTFTLRARRSPKRHPSFDESDTSRFSTPSKRRKISISNTSTLSNGASQSSSPPYHRMSPSPTASVSTAPGDAGVSVAMLRALTRDMKAKYGSSPLAKG